MPQFHSTALLYSPMTLAVEHQFDRRFLIEQAQWRPIYLVLTLIGLLFGGNLAAAWQQPLSEAEVATAARIALPPIGEPITATSSDIGNNLLQRLRALGLPNSQSPVGGPAHPLGVQILLTELREQKNPTANSGRLVEVFSFDYQRRVTELNLVDLVQGAVISTIQVASAHLPLSAAEIQYSQLLMAEHEEVRARVRSELERLPTGVAADDEFFGLQARVAIWVPANTALLGASGCDLERCALISLFTADDDSLSIEPVVNLITGEIYSDLVQ